MSDQKENILAIINNLQKLCNDSMCLLAKLKAKIDILDKKALCDEEVKSKEVIHL